MRIESRLLDGTRLVEGLLRQDPAALSFFPGDPRELNSYRSKAREVEGRFTREERARAATHLAGGGAGASERLRTFVERDGFMVTTGQQASLFGGPLFALYKGLTAAALARRLQELLDRPVLPVFWVASEDHDWEEVRRVRVLDVENQLQEVALPPREGGPAPPIHRILLGPEMEEVRERFLALHPGTEYLPRWRELLEEAYIPGSTLASGFQRVMEALLGPAGVFVVHAHDPGLKARTLPILLRELADTPERIARLRERGAELGRAGFGLQVPILEGGSNLFFEGPGGRERLFVDGGGFRLRNSGKRLTHREIEALAHDDPLVLSPNVLLRPVVESAVLPTLSYVAGPGEAAYLSQTEPVFRGHGIERPVVHPRAALLLLETKISKVLRKFDLDLADLALPPHELATRLLRKEVPPRLEAAITGLRGAIESGADELEEAVKGLDPTLRGPVESMRTQGVGLIDDVERKVLGSLRRESEVALAQVEKARAHLLPLGKPQERVLNPFYYLVRYGDGFLGEVELAASGAVLPHIQGDA